MVFPISHDRVDLDRILSVLKILLLGVPIFLIKCPGDLPLFELVVPDPQVECLTHHAHRPTGAHVVIVAIPAEEFRVVTMLQDELLASEVRVIKADPGSTLHTDGVHSVHKASVLEVVTVPKHLQFPPCEVLALIESDLERPAERSGAGDSPLLDPTSSTVPRLPFLPITVDA